MYIDPSTTTYVVQIVAAIVVTCGVMVGVFWKKIKTFFSRKNIERTEKSLKEKYGDTEEQ
jgi:hypothetical protein